MLRENCAILSHQIVQRIDDKINQPIRRSVVYTSWYSLLEVGTYTLSYAVLRQDGLLPWLPIQCQYKHKWDVAYVMLLSQAGGRNPSSILRNRLPTSSIMLSQFVISSLLSSTLTFHSQPYVGRQCSVCTHFIKRCCGLWVRTVNE